MFRAIQWILGIVGAIVGLFFGYKFGRAKTEEEVKKAVKEERMQAAYFYQEKDDIAQKNIELEIEQEQNTQDKIEELNNKIDSFVYEKDKADSNRKNKKTETETQTKMENHKSSDPKKDSSVYKNNETNNQKEKDKKIDNKTTRTEEDNNEEVITITL